MSWQWKSASPQRSQDLGRSASLKWDLSNTFQYPLCYFKSFLPADSPNRLQSSSDFCPIFTLPTVFRPTLLLSKVSILSNDPPYYFPTLCLIITWFHVLLSLWISLVICLRLCSRGNFASLFTMDNSLSIKTKSQTPNNERVIEHTQRFIPWTCFYCVTRVQRVKWTDFPLYAENYCLLPWFLFQA